MFDYKFGIQTSRLTWTLSSLVPNGPSIPFSLRERALTLAFQFLTGIEVMRCARVSKVWYAAACDYNTWREICQAMDPRKCEAFVAEASQIARSLVITETVRQLVIYKSVYLSLLLKVCAHCSEVKTLLRFLPLAERSLCANCAGLARYQMMSFESAELELEVTPKELDRVRGLRLPRSTKSGDPTYVYYVSDLLRLKGVEAEIPVRDCTQELRRAELLRLVRRLGVEDRELLKQHFNFEGSLVYNFVQGTARSSAVRIARQLANHLKKGGGVQRQRLTPEEMDSRREELVKRLTSMGLTVDKIGLDNPKSLANAYIHGRTQKPLGRVAGTIWEENKPVFTGIETKTTKRLSDL